jgi:hypothetical protein
LIRGGGPYDVRRSGCLWLARFSPMWAAARVPLSSPLPGPAARPAPAARGPRRHRRATPATRPAHRPPAGVHPRRDHDRRAADPGRPAARGQTAEVTIETDTCQITVDEGITITAPRTTSRDINRHKASDYG